MVSERTYLGLCVQSQWSCCVTTVQTVRIKLRNVLAWNGPQFLRRWIVMTLWISFPRWNLQNGLAEDETKTFMVSRPVITLPKLQPSSSVTKMVLVSTESFQHWRTCHTSYRLPPMPHDDRGDFLPSTSPSVPAPSSPAGQTFKSFSYSLWSCTHS